MNDACNDRTTVNGHQVLTSSVQRIREYSTELRLDPGVDIRDRLLNDHFLDQMHNWIATKGVSLSVKCNAVDCGCIVQGEERAKGGKEDREPMRRTGRGHETPNDNFRASAPFESSITRTQGAASTQVILGDGRGGISARYGGEEDGEKHGHEELVRHGAASSMLSTKPQKVCVSHKVRASVQEKRRGRSDTRRVVALRKGEREK